MEFLLETKAQQKDEGGTMKDEKDITLLRRNPHANPLVPRLCLGMHCPRGSASRERTVQEAEPSKRCVPRQSLGTRVF
jgi:hypothetical protein